MRTQDGGRPVEILLVESDPADARLAQATLDESKLLNRLHVVPDGPAALAFLRREGRYAEAPRPDLILLDLDLPHHGGQNVLADIKADSALSRIPVVVLAAAGSEDDITRGYDLQANCFISKPIDLEQFTRIVKCIEGFWLSIVTLPPRQ